MFEEKKKKKQKEKKKSPTQTVPNFRPCFRFYFQSVTPEKTGDLSSFIFLDIGRNVEASEWP